MTPTVAIVILNWCNAPDTLACLASVTCLDYPAYRTLVVDNGSTDGSVAAIRAAYPEVELLETGENLGYAGGNNVGIRHALAQGADYILVLNNDVTLAPDCLSRLVAVAEGDRDAGFIGPMIYQGGTLNQIQSAGTLMDQCGRWHQRGLNALDVGQFDNETSADSLVGCALLIAARVLETIGLLDESFYLYDEDIDWCLRAREAGFSIRFVPGAKVWHRSSDARGAELPRLTYYINRNRYLLMRKHNMSMTARLYTLVQHLIWLGNWSLNPKWRSKRAERDALFWALADAFRGQFGQRRLRHVF
jgi:hypothetical protein